MSVNPFDPLGIGKAIQDQFTRAATRAAEAARQARITAAKADVVAAYAGWTTQPDGPATENLQEALSVYLTALEM